MSRVWIAPESDRQRRAYRYFAERNEAAGCVVHGHDAEDYDRATREMTWPVKDRAGEAELALIFFSLRPWSWWEVLAWNKLVLKILPNDYFPLLKTDDMAGHGDRVSPVHMLDTLIQTDRIVFRDRGLTEEEYDDLLEYRKSLKDVVDYVVADAAERKGDLSSILNHPENRLKMPVYDVGYIWEGRPFVREPSIKPKGERLGTSQSRAAVPGDRVRVLRNNVSAARPGGGGVLVPGDQIVVSRIAEFDSQMMVWYKVDHGENYIPLSDVEGVNFTIHRAMTTPRDFGPPDLSYRDPRYGVNALSDCMALDREYRHEFRLTPQHLAEAIALRYLGFLTAQQCKALIEKLWDTWSNGTDESQGKIIPHDIIHYVREMRLLEGVEGDIDALLDKVLADNARAVEDFKGGKSAAFGRIMGAAMKACKGRGNPQEVKSLLEVKLTA